MARADDTARANMAKEAVAAFKPVAEEMSNAIKQSVGDMSNAVRNSFGVVAETSKEELGLVHDFAAAKIKSLANLFTGPLAESVKAVLGLGAEKDEGNEADQQTAMATKETVEEVKKAHVERKKQTPVFTRIWEEMRMMRRFFVDDFQDTQEAIKEAVQASSDSLEAAISGAGGEEPGKKKNPLLEALGGILGGMFGPITILLLAAGAFALAMASEFVIEVKKNLKILFGWVLKPFAKILVFIKESKFGQMILKVFKPVTRYFDDIWKLLSRVGGLIAKNPVVARMLKLGGGLGKFLGKIFLPITILMTAWDAISGFMAAEGIFGEGAGLIQKMEAAIGGIISGLTFGLLDGETVAKLIENTRQKFIAGWNNVLDTIKEFWSFITDGELLKTMKDFMKTVWHDYIMEPVKQFFITIKDALASVLLWVGEKLDFVPGIGASIKDFASAMKADVTAARGVMAEEAQAIKIARGAQATGAQTEMLAGPGLFAPVSTPPINVLQQNASAPTFMTQGFNSQDEMWSSLGP